MDDLKNNVQREFAARAEAYVASTTHATGDDLARLIELSNITPSTTALDIATGGGHVALALSRTARFVVAADLSHTMLQSAARFLASKSRTNVAYTAADAEALPFADFSFNLVTCRIAPHHFPNVAHFVQECARVLTPGGIFALEDSVVPEDPDLDAFMNTLERTRDYTHGRSYTEREWRAFAQQANLAVLQTETYVKPHPFADWMQRGAMLNPELDYPTVEQMLRTANPQTTQEFNIRITPNNEILSFQDRKLILIAQK